MNDQPDCEAARENLRAIELAQLSLDQCRRMMEEAGLTPDACLDRLRRLEGDSAVEQLRRSVDDSFRGFQDQVERDATHAAPMRPLSRRATRRGFI